MSHTAFGEFFPEIADRETRVVTIIDQAITGLPPGAYALIDLYCTDPDCDCRNVYIHVVHKGFPGPIATITYGWEKPLKQPLPPPPPIIILPKNKPV